MTEIFDYLTIPMILAGIGLIIATSSFISGLQLVRGNIGAIVELKIHRGNGYATITIFAILAIISIIQSGFGFWAVAGWLSGLSVILAKIHIVRKRKRRAFKYVSWMGATYILIWLLVIYLHIPV